MNFLSNYFLSAFPVIFLIWLFLRIIYLGRWSKAADFILALIILLILSYYLGFRGVHSGTDTLNYTNYFNQLGSNSARKFEFGFELLSLFLKMFKSAEFYIFSLTFIQFFFVLSAFSILHLKEKGLLLLLYVSFMPGLDLATNGLRQGIMSTFAIFIIALIIEKGRSYKFILPVLPLFHNSGIFYSIFLFTSKKFITARKVLLSLLGCALIFVGWEILLQPEMLMSLLNSTQLPLIGNVDYLAKKLIIYISVEREIFKSSVRFYFLFVAGFLSAVILYVMYRFRIAREDPKYIEMIFYAFTSLYPFALIWISNYSYRFFYISYPLLFLAAVYGVFRYGHYLERIGFIIICIGFSVLTFGSNSFSTFKYLDIL